MKTDTVEIFQTIRALLQPYTTQGFASRTSSETFYDLWSDKQVDVNGEKIDISAFARVEVKEDFTEFCVIEESEKINCMQLKKLDEDSLSDITRRLEMAYTNYKQKGWV